MSYQDIADRSVQLKQLNKVFKHLSTANSTFPLQQLRILFTIAKRERPISSNELIEELNMTQGSLSRNVKALSH